MAANSSSSVSIGGMQYPVSYSSFGIDAFREWRSICRCFRSPYDDLVFDDYVIEDEYAFGPADDIEYDEGYYPVG